MQHGGAFRVVQSSTIHQAVSHLNGWRSCPRPSAGGIRCNARSYITVTLSASKRLTTSGHAAQARCADRFDLSPSPTEGRNNEGEGEWKCYPHRECPCRPFLARALQLPQPPHSREGDRRKRGLSLPMHAAMMDVRGSLRPIPLAQARGGVGVETRSASMISMHTLLGPRVTAPPAPSLP